MRRDQAQHPGQQAAHLQRIRPGAVWRGFFALEQTDVDQQAAAICQVQLAARAGDATHGAVVGETQLRSRHVANLCESVEPGMLKPRTACSKPAKGWDFGCNRLSGTPQAAAMCRLVHTNSRLDNRTPRIGVGRQGGATYHPNVQVQPLSAISSSRAHQRNALAG